MPYCTKCGKSIKSSNIVCKKCLNSKKSNKSTFFKFIIIAIIAIFVFIIVYIISQIILKPNENQVNTVVESKTEILEEPEASLVANSDTSQSTVALGGPAVGVWSANYVVVGGVNLSIDIIAQTGLVDNFKGELEIDVDTFGTFLVTADGTTYTGTWNYIDSTQTAINYSADIYEGVGEFEEDTIKLLNVMDLGVDVIMEKVEP